MILSLSVEVKDDADPLDIANALLCAARMAQFDLQEDGVPAVDNLIGLGSELHHSVLLFGLGREKLQAAKAVFIEANYFRSE